MFLKLNPNGYAIVNGDDPYKDYYLLPANHNFTYGWAANSDYQIVNYRMSNHKMPFTYQYRNQKYDGETTLLGRYNLYNILASIIALRNIGITAAAIHHILPQLTTPAGRWENDSVIKLI